MGNSNFDKLIRRYLENRVSEEERIKIEAWMDVRKTGDTGDLELSPDDADKIYQKIISSNTTEREIRELASVKGRRTFMWWAYRAAASLLLVALVGYLGWKHGFQDGAVTEFASAGVTEKVILKDGSLVWLKGNSSLIYYYDYGADVRYSELKGEALFEVAKDAAHPFIIRCGNATLKVLGTSFSVRAVDDSIELHVLTGKVNFSTSEDQDGVDVAPNEKVLYRESASIVKVSMEADDVSDITGDTEYPMSFRNAMLGEVLMRLEKKFDVVFTLDNKVLASCRVTLDITDHSLDKSLEILSDVLNITWKQDGKTIRVGGTGC